jgi:tetratricopeptide (TPR) repeat protein
MKKVLPFLFVLFLSPLCYSQNSYQTQLDNAENCFKQGNFLKSIEIYESLIYVEKINNAVIFYNLANAYYRNGNIGKAVLNISRAKMLLPRDREVNKNFETIFKASGQQFEKLFLLSFFSLNEISVFFAAGLILLCVFLSLSMLSRKRLKTYIFISAAVLVISSPFFAAKIYDEIITVFAVALSDIGAKSGPSESAASIFEIPEGKVLEIISENSGWLHIQMRTADNKTDVFGWVKKDNVGKINF